jgi:hypothetical protein
LYITHGTPVPNPTAIFAAQLVYDMLAAPNSLPIGHTRSQSAHHKTTSNEYESSAEQSQE